MDKDKIKLRPDYLLLKRSEYIVLRALRILESFYLLLIFFTLTYGPLFALYLSVIIFCVLYLIDTIIFISFKNG